MKSIVINELNLCSSTLVDNEKDSEIHFRVKKERAEKENANERIAVNVIAIHSGFRHTLSV